MNMFCGGLWGMVILLTCAACQRNASEESGITFTGTVYRGHLDATTSSPVADETLPHAIVTCNGFPDKAETGIDGRYVLHVATARRFTAVNADQYQLTAASTNGQSEQLTAFGKPGDTISVRVFILYKHPEEK